MLEAREIGMENLSEIMDVKVLPYQEKYVAPNAVTVAQFHYEPSAWMRGLWDGDMAIGLIAMINPSVESPSFDEGDPDDGGFLWRLMIGLDHQGKGYGRAAMEVAYRQAGAWGFDKLYTSCVLGENTPLPFYEKLGLSRTGRMLDGEVELVGPIPT